MNPRYLVSWCLLFGLAQPVAAQPWTRFRGPNGTGVASTAVPVVWTERDYNWKSQLPGLGHSSPVVWQDHVFVLSADPEQGTQYLVALDARDGKILWQRATPSATYKIHTRSSFASSTPTVDAQYVYAAWATPEATTLVALDHAGQLVWERQLGTYASQHGFGTSPILYEDLVILNVSQEKANESDPITDTSQIIAVDRRTGETRWSTPRRTDVVSYSVPCLRQLPGRAAELICCSTADGMYSLDPLTGKPNWSVDAFEMRTVSSPVLAGELVVGTTGSGAGGNYLVAINPAANPQITYHVRKQAPYVPTPVVHGDLIFLWFDKGVVSCHRVTDGELLWQERVGGNYSGSPILAGDRLYCVDEDGTVVVLAAKDKYELLGKNSLGEPSRSTPAVADGRLYLRTYSHLISIGGGQGGGAQP